MDWLMGWWVPSLKKVDWAVYYSNTSSVWHRSAFVSKPVDIGNETQTDHKPPGPGHGTMEQWTSSLVLAVQKSNID